MINIIKQKGDDDEKEETNQTNETESICSSNCVSNQQPHLYQHKQKRNVYQGNDTDKKKKH